MGAGTSRLTARSWILLDSKSSLVTLQHGQTSGQRIITIGDKEVINTSKAVDFGSEHKFTHSDQKIVIKITCTKSTYSYTLTCDGKLLECRPVAYDVEINIYRTCRELESCVSTIWKLDDNNLFCHLRHGLQSGKRSLWCGGEQMFMERKTIDTGSTHTFLYKTTEYHCVIKAKMMGGYTYKLSEMHNGKIFRELDSHLDLIDEGPNNTCLNVKRRSPKTQPRRRPSLTRRSPGNTPKTSPNSTPRTSPIPPSKSLAIIGEGGYSSPTPSTSTSRFEEEKLQRWSINVIEFVVRGEGVERESYFKIKLEDAGVHIGSTEHLYTEFVTLNSLLRSMYKGTSVAKLIPGEVPKDIGNTSDPFDQEFLRKRQKNLNLFLSKLEYFPNLMDIPGIEEFLGLHII